MMCKWHLEEVLYREFDSVWNSNAMIYIYLIISNLRAKVVLIAPFFRCFNYIDIGVSSTIIAQVTGLAAEEIEKV